MRDDGVDLLLDEDTPCARCKFNLRGLPTRHACPECGTPYEESTEYPCHDPACRDLARRTGYYADAIMFVLGVVEHAAAGRLLSRWWWWPGNRDLTAVDVCRSFRSVAPEFFASESDARRLLGAWGLRRSEDLGALIFTLVQEGHLFASPGDKPEDFLGLFTLDDLFATPHPVLDAGRRAGRPA